MNEEEYALTQSQILMLASLIMPLDLAGFLRAIDRAETLGPFLDPTLYRAAARELRSVKAVAEALHGAQIKLRKLLPDQGSQ